MNFKNTLNHIERHLEFWKEAHVPEQATNALQDIPDHEIRLYQIVANGTWEETERADAYIELIKEVSLGKFSKSGKPIHMHMIEECTRPGRNFDYSNDP